ncbi:hypothetical protein BKA63DRAFT_605165 [Paraphoma chrysanthemicola]|nr:hypothetical protein BKA63DRAFT_605165 [Paraphoma chrysanthemicola]
MSKELVIITVTDFYTVYPSQVAASCVATSTPPIVHSSMLNPTSVAQSAVPTSDTHGGMSMSTSNPSTTSLLTGLPPLPSEFAKPSSKPQPRSSDTAFMAILITAIVLGGFLLLSLICKTILVAFKGGCSSCKDKDEQIRKYVTGNLTYISPKMVRNREKLASEASRSHNSRSTTCHEPDLERGEMTKYEAQKQAEHDAAIAACYRPPTPTRTAAFWGKLTGAFKTRTKLDEGKCKSTVFLSTDEPKSPFDDRYFVVGDEKELDLEAQNVTIPHAPYQPSIRRLSSIYSPNTSTRPSNRPFQTHDVEAGPSHPPRTHRPHDSHLANSHSDTPSPLDAYQARTHSQYLREDWEPRNVAALASFPDDASIISSSLNIYDPRHAARYEEAQRILVDSDRPDEEVRRAVQIVNAVEKQKWPMRRLRAYGGLPHPDEFEREKDGRPF